MSAESIAVHSFSAKYPLENTCRSYLLTLRDGGGDLLDTNLLAKFLPAVEPTHGSTVVELDLSSKRSLLDVALLLPRLCAHVLTKATKLMLEGCTWIRLKPRILKPEWTTLDSGL